MTLRAKVHETTCGEGAYRVEVRLSTTRFGWQCTQTCSPLPLVDVARRRPCKLFISLRASLQRPLASLHAARPQHPHPHRLSLNEMLASRQVRPVAPNARPSPLWRFSSSMVGMLKSQATTEASATGTRARESCTSFRSHIPSRGRQTFEREPQGLCRVS